MLAIFIVMFTLELFIYTGTNFVTTRQADRTLSGILRYDEALSYVGNASLLPYPSFLGSSNIESPYSTRFFIVRVNPYGEVESVTLDFIASVDEETACSYAAKALNKDKERGFIDDYRYVIRETDGRTVAAFLNISPNREVLQTLLSLSAIVLLCGMFLAFIVVFFLSKKAIRPFVQNIEQQKRFITDAGHELKTPLTSISASLDVIEAEHGWDEWHDNIRNQTVRMTHLVSSLVSLSRLDEFNPLPSRENFSLSDCAWEVSAPFTSTAQSQGKTFSSDIAENVMINGDRASVCRLISVLLDNALRYCTENGKISFSVKAESNKAVICVSNTCSYTTPPDTKRIFDRFYRPDQGRGTETGGYGLGLAIAKSVVLSHGGNISAECPDGKSMTIKAVFKLISG